MALTHTHTGPYLRRVCHFTDQNGDLCCMLKKCVKSSWQVAAWLMATTAMAAANARTNLAPTPLDSQVVQLMHSHQQPEEGLVRGHLLRASQHSLYVWPEQHTVHPAQTPNLLSVSGNGTEHCKLWGANQYSHSQAPGMRCLHNQTLSAM